VACESALFSVTGGGDDVDACLLNKFSMLFLKIFFPILDTNDKDA
jgi:hypothetical protein